MRSLRVQVLALALMGLLGAAFALSAGTGVGDSSLEFSEGRRVDLGIIPAGSHDWNFRVKNTGARPVRIDKIIGSCTCTVAEFPPCTLLPGESKQCQVKLSATPDRDALALLFVSRDQPAKGVDTVRVKFRGGARGELSPVLPNLEILSQLPGKRVRRPVEFRYRPPEDLQRQPVPFWAMMPRGAFEIVRQSSRVENGDIIYSAVFQSAPLLPNKEVLGLALLNLGSPPIASASMPIRIDVERRLHVSPTSLCATVSGDGPFPEPAGEFAWKCGGTYRLSSVETPPWMTSEHHDRGAERVVRLLVTRRPPFEVGVGEVVAAFSSDSGPDLTCRVRVALEVKEEEE